MKLFIVLLLLSSACNAQEISLTLGIGIPVFDNDTFNGNNNITDKYDAARGDGLGVLIITIPFNTFDFLIFHESLITSNLDDGLTGIAITKTWTGSF